MFSGIVLLEECDISVVQVQSLHSCNAPKRIRRVRVVKRLYQKQPMAMRVQAYILAICTGATTWRCGSLGTCPGARTMHLKASRDADGDLSPE